MIFADDNSCGTNDDNDEHYRDVSSSSIIPTCWWDGTPINNGDGQDDSSCTANADAPPLYTGWTWPNGCVPYYRTAYKRLAKTFVEGHGRPYMPLYQEMEHILSFQGDSSSVAPTTTETTTTTTTTTTALPSNVFSHMLPSFFHTLQVLTEQQQQQQRDDDDNVEVIPFRLVLRSFGSDVHQVAQAISTFAQGKHPGYPNFRNDNLVVTPDDLVKGRWSTSSDDDDGEITFQLCKEDGSIVASGDPNVLEWIQQRTICGIQDDYDFWSRNQCQPWAGKPVWVPARACHQHHLLFDDNIHNLAHDSIASVRMQSKPGGTFRTLSGKEIQRRMQGIHLIRVPTVEPILNPEWFLQQIDLARARYAASDDESSHRDE